MGPVGFRSSMRGLRNSIWATRSSSVMTVARPVRPWTKPFMTQTSLPFWVRGPVDFLALARLAANCLSDIGMVRYLLRTRAWHADLSFDRRRAVRDRKQDVDTF